AAVVYLRNKHWAAKHGAKLVLMEGRGGAPELIPEWIASVERIIAHEFPHASVKLVSAATRHDTDDTAENATILGLIVVRLDFELLDGVNDRWNNISTCVQLGVNHAVQHIQVRTVGLPLNGGLRHTRRRHPQHS